MRVGLLALPAGVLISPGLWQVTLAEGESVKAVYELCLPSGDERDLRRLLPRLAPRTEACPEATYRIEGRQLYWEFGCAPAGLQASGVFTVAPQEIWGETSVRRAGVAAPQHQRLGARRIGDCSGGAGAFDPRRGR